MKCVRILLALGVLALSGPAQAKTVYPLPPGTPTCGSQSWVGRIIDDVHGKKPCTAAVSLPGPATLGLLGVALIALAVKRRRK